MKICDDFCFNFNTNSLLNKGRFRMGRTPLETVPCYICVPLVYQLFMAAKPTPIKANKSISA